MCLQDFSLQRTHLWTSPIELLESSRNGQLDSPRLSGPREQSRSHKWTTLTTKTHSISSTIPYWLYKSLFQSGRKPHKDLNTKGLESLRTVWRDGSMLSSTRDVSWQASQPRVLFSLPPPTASDSLYAPFLLMLICFNQTHRVCHWISPYSDP